MPSDSLLHDLNALLESPFQSLEACLDHYRAVLGERVGDYHQEEVGPVYHHDEPGEADLFVRKIFHLGEGTVDMSGGLDWYATANGDLEWNGGLVRHGYFMLLASAYRSSGREVYAETILEHLLHYIENVPPFDPAGRSYLDYKKSTWRPFEVAGRAAETWPEALAKIIRSPALTPEKWARILISIHEHAVFLRREHWKTGNHATLEVAAIGIIAVFYREFREREAWLAYAVDFLDTMWPVLFAEDGYSREMSGSYHWVAMRSYLSFYEVACRNGFAGLFPSSYRERLIRNSLAELYQGKPDGSTPVSNDSSSAINRRPQLERINRLLALPEISHVLSQGREGSPPPATSFFFPASRIGIMRSDWSADASYLYFDMGPWGDNHMTQDQLSVEVSAGGRNFLVNGGKWRYTTSDPDTEWMPLARYFKTTASCNAVLVNGHGQVFGDAQGRMVTSPEFDYADGCFAAGFGEEAPGRDETLFRERGLATRMENRLPGVTHRRQVFFARPHGWILRDTITGPGIVRVDQLWHFLEGRVRPLDPAGSCWATDFPDSNLIVWTVGKGAVEARLHEGRRTPFFAGWHCPAYDQLRPAPELRFTVRQGGPVVLHTLLLPVSGPVRDRPQFEFSPHSYLVRRPGLELRVHAPVDGDWSPA